MNRKKRKLVSLGLGMALLVQAGVQGAAPDYQEVWNSIQQDSQQIVQRQVQDSQGKGVNILGSDDTLYVIGKETALRDTPDENGKELQTVSYGAVFQRTGVCENGWSQGILEEDGQTLTGYIKTDELSPEEQIEEVQEEGVLVTADTDVVDFPARKDGEVIGEVLQDEEVERTGIIHQVWSQIRYVDKNKEEFIGYVPTSSLDVEETRQEKTSSEEEPGVIHKSSGKGVFADAVSGVTQVSDGDGIITAEGAPVKVGSGAVLKDLGEFRITHYCACSICCGAYASGITATGTTCTTNRTIAVNPSQIPYGSKVVINGQVYIAEDCGGAIKDNCIDIYVATHEEGLAKGMYYTEVYLLEENN